MEKKEKTVIVTVGLIGAVLGVIAFITNSTVAKWICGILAALLIGLCFYMIVDSILVHKRRKEAIRSIVNQEMGKPGFAQKMADAQHRRDILFDGQQPEKPDYGYSASNPIMTSTIEDNEKYLARLRTLDGKSFTWVRNGSVGMEKLHGVDVVMVDKYQLYLEGKEHKIVYICPYGHNSSYAPQGMKLAY